VAGTDKNWLDTRQVHRLIETSVVPVGVGTVDTRRQACEWRHRVTIVAMWLTVFNYLKTVKLTEKCICYKICLRVANVDDFYRESFFDPIRYFVD
jgi:hypothetical protein